MAIQINQTLHASGLTIPTGSLVTFTPIFVDRRESDGQGGYQMKHELHANLRLFKSLTDFENGSSQIGMTPDEFDSLGVVRNISDTEYSALDTDTGVLSTIEGWVKDQIDNFSGIDPANTEIVRPFSS